MYCFWNILFYQYFATLADATLRIITAIPSMTTNKPGQGTQSCALLMQQQGDLCDCFRMSKVLCFKESQLDEEMHMVNLQ